jgi:hypothetical protein
MGNGREMGKEGERKGIEELNGVYSIGGMDEIVPVKKENPRESVKMPNWLTFKLFTVKSLRKIILAMSKMLGL